LGLGWDTNLVPLQIKLFSPEANFFIVLTPHFSSSFPLIFSRPQLPSRTLSPLLFCFFSFFFLLFNRKKHYLFSSYFLSLFLIFRENTLFSSYFLLKRHRLEGEGGCSSFVLLFFFPFWRFGEGKRGSRKGAFSSLFFVV